MAHSHLQKPSTSQSDAREFSVSDAEGLQLQGNRNLFQFASLLIFVVIGAGVGWAMTEDRPDIAALVGGVLGMIVGTFISGFMLMLLPPPKVTLTLSEFGTRCRTLKRRLIIASVAFAAGIFGLPVVISQFGHDDSDFAWCMCLAWIATTVGLCAYTKTLAHRIRELKCPACGERFGRISSPCIRCGLSTFAGGELASEPSDARETSAPSVLKSKLTPRSP